MTSMIRLGACDSRASRSPRSRARDRACERAGRVPFAAGAPGRAGRRRRRHRHGVPRDRARVGRAARADRSSSRTSRAAARCSAATSSRRRSPTATRCSPPACRSRSTRRSAASCRTTRSRTSRRSRIVVSQPLLVVVNPAVPVKSMAELVAYAKAQKAPLQYTTGGIGSYGHLWWEMVRARQGIDGQHVAYNGIAPALKDVMGGQVPLLIDAIVPTGAQVQGGHGARHRDRRVAAREVAARPADALRAGLHRARRRAVLRRARAGGHGCRPSCRSSTSTLMRALATPALRDKLQELGFDVVASTPDAYAKLIRDEIDRWSKVVKQRTSRSTEHGRCTPRVAQPDPIQRSRRRDVKRIASRHRRT